MKKIKLIVLLIFLLIPSIQGYVKPYNDSYKTADVVIEKPKADFRVAYKRLIKYEGYYVNDPNDYGGETYKGISRKFNPKWLGWKYIDAIKRKTYVHPNEQFGGMIDFYAQDYYLDIWVKEGFDQLKSQQVANYFLDFRIHSNCLGILITRKVLLSMGEKIDTTKYVVDQEMIDALNRVDPNKFINALKLKRIQLYNTIVWRDTTQKVFYKTWITRAKDVESIDI